MGATPGKFHPVNGSATVQARLSGASINRGLSSVITVDAFKIPEIAECCAANADADLKHMHKALAHLLQLFSVEPACWSVGCNACCKQALVGIDISCPCHQ